MFIAQIDIWLNAPLYWLIVFIAVGFLSTIFHELGHALFAKIAGYQITRLDFGKPSMCRLTRIAGAEIYLGLPFGGCFYFKWTTNDKSTPFKIAFIAIGGWVIDCIVFLFLMLILSDADRSQGYGYIATAYLFLKVVVGLSPLTSDGRMLIKSLYFGFNSYRNNH